MKQLVQRIVSWIKEEVVRTNGQGVVVGMSGGVDSSVAAVLCHIAFPEATLGMIMPCHSEESEEVHAKLVANKFGITVVKIVLDKVFDALLKELYSKKLQTDRNRLAEGNMKSRLRMTVLYYLANSFNYRVVGASNRSELSVGYFTKYGDGGVDLMPLGNLVKGEIREIALYLGIPQEIIEKPPSAGLWPGQTDEDELGLTYDELDSFLKTGKAKKEIKERINVMMMRTLHKRLPPSLPSTD